MMETVSHTFKRELDHVVDRDMMDTLSQVINGSLDTSVYALFVFFLYFRGVMRPRFSFLFWHYIYCFACLYRMFPHLS